MVIRNGLLFQFYICRIPYDSYMKAEVLLLFLVPVTILDIVLFPAWNIEKYWLPILTGCLLRYGVSIGKHCIM